MANELASAYVTLIPTLKGAQSAIEKQLGGMDFSKAGNAVGAGVSKGLSGGLASAGKAFGAMAKAGVAALGAIGGSVAGIAAQGGIARAMKLEHAQHMFKGLGFTAEQTASAMDSANKAVDGTAFGLDAAAQAAALLSTSGVQLGGDMTRSLQAIAGSATMAGTSMEDITDIFQVVAAQGKVSARELNRLSERGINATSVLAEHLGIAQDEVRALVSSGKVDFKTFSDAMYEAFGDAAQGANETFSGALANVRAALSRIGAKFAAPAMEGLRRVFVSLIPALKAVESALAPVAEGFGRVMQSVAGAVAGKVDAFARALQEGGSALDGLKAAFGPVGGMAVAVAGAVSGLGAVFGVLSSAIGMVVPPLSGLVGALSGGGGVLGASMAAGGGLGGLRAALAGVGGPVLAVVAAAAALAAGFAHLMATDESFRGSVVGLASDIGAALLPIVDTLVSSVTELAAGVMPAVTAAIESVLPAIGAVALSVMEFAAGVLPVISSAVQTIATAVIPAVVSAANGLLPVISQIVTAVLGFVAAVMPVVESLYATVIPIIAQIIAMAAQFAAEVAAAVIPVLEMVASMIEQNMPVIQGVVTGAMQAIQAVIQTVWPAIQAVIQTVLGVISGVIKTVTSLIRGDWTGVWNGIKGVAQSVWNGIKGVVQAGINAVSGVVGNVMGAIRNIWDRAWSGVKTLVSNAWNGIRSAVGDGISGMMSAIGELPGKIMGFFANAGEWLVNSGSAIIDGLTSGIRSAFDGAKNVVSSGLEGLRSLFPFSPAKEGPFSGRGWVLYSGMSIMDALAEGAEKRLPGLLASYGVMAEKARDALSESWRPDALYGAPQVDVQRVQPRPAAPDASGDADGAAVIGWLEENLGHVIAAYAPVTGERSFGRMARKAVAR